jgi:tetratricopeptide (TPR) repeat protein
MKTHQLKIRLNAAVPAVIIILMAGLGCAGPKKAAPRADDVYGARAYGYFLEGDHPRAIEVYKRGFAAARRDDNASGAARYLSNIGRAHYELERLDSAAVYFAKAHEEFSILGDRAEASKAAAWLALSFASAGDSAQAQRWYSASVLPALVDRQKGAEHFYAVMKALIDFRLTSQINNEPGLDAAYAFYKKGKNHAALSTIYPLKAGLALSKGDCAAAGGYLQDALSSMENAGERHRRSRALLKLAALSFCAGDGRMGKHYYERALDCAPKGITVPPPDEVSSCAGDWAIPKCRKL